MSRAQRFFRPVVLALVSAGLFACASGPRDTWSESELGQQKVQPQPEPTVEASTDAAESAVEAQKPEEQVEPAFAWRAKSPKGRMVTLVGSVHMLMGGDFRVPEAVEDAFEQRDVMVMEIDPAESEASQGRIPEVMLLQPGKSLEDAVSSRTLRLAHSRADRIGFPREQLSRLKPWAAALLLGVLSAVEVGYRPEDGVEYYFLDADRGEKPILGLETVEEQLGWVDRLAAPAQEAMLAESCRSLEEVESEFASIVAAWRQGDVSAMDKALFESLDEHPHAPAIANAVFFERNRRMAARIDGLTSKHANPFVVVGAGHFVGERGILALLRARGYAIEQMSF